MADYDYIEIESMGNGDFKVTPRENGGCCSIVGFIIFLLIIALPLTYCSDSTRRSEKSNASDVINQHTEPISDTTWNSGLEMDLEISEGVDEANICDIVSLSSLEPYTYSSESKPAHYTNMKDTLGNVYNDAWLGFGTESDGGSWLIYDICGKYKTLTGTIIVREEDKGEPDAACIRIYGDGVLLYEKTDITSDTKPIQIEVDITNVVDLKIEFNCGGGNWMYGYHVYAVICDVFLVRDNEVQ